MPRAATVGSVLRYITNANCTPRCVIVRVDRGVIVKRVSVLALALLLTANALVQAQISAEGSIRGLVRDAQGAVLPGATITAASPAVAGVRTTVSEAQGDYRLIDVPPGEYTIVAELQGFSKASRTGVLVRAGLNLSIDFTLQVGTVLETVMVAGDTPMLETQRTVQAVNVSGEMQRRLPLTVGGHWSGVTLLTPGVAAQAAEAGMGGVYFNRGTDNESHVVQVDGADVGSFRQQWPAAYFGVSTEALQDVQVKTAGIDATSPLAQGMVINIATVSGTNQFRGALGTVYTAESWNSNNVPGGTPRTVKIIQPDLSGGGPIRRDKAWFYAAARFSSERAGIGRTADVVARLEALRPGFEPFDNKRSQKFWYVKGTAQFSQNHQAYAFAQRDVDPRDSNAADWADPFDVLAFGGYGYGARLSSVWGASVTTRLLAAYNNKGINTDFKIFDGRVVDNGPAVLVHRDAFLSSGQLVGSGSIAQLNNLQTRNLWPTSKLTFSGDLTYAKNGWLGSHEFQVGVYLQPRLRVDTVDRYANGGFLLEEVVLRDRNNFSAGYSPFHRRILGVSELTSASVGAQDDAVYVQDAWRPTGRLTVTAGVRIDWIQGKDRLFDVVVLDDRAVGPRFGATYQLTSDSKNVVRASWGRVHEAPIGLRIGAAGTNRAGARDLYDLNLDGVFETEFVTPASTILSTNREIDPNRRQPFVNEWLAGYRRQFAGQLSLDASFIQRRYKHRPALIEMNGKYDGNVFSGYRNEAFNDIFLVTSNKWNWPVYSGIELTAAKQTRSLQVLAGYTRAFQHLDGTWQPNDPASFIEPEKFDNDGGLGSISRANETNSLSGSADIRNQMWLKHIGRVGAVYMAPWGIVIAGTVSAQSGLLSGPVVTRIAAADSRFGPATVQLSNGRVVPNPLATTIRFAFADRGEGQIEGPAIIALNARFGRDFAIGSRRLEAALDVFNITNRGAVQSFLGGGNQTYSPNFAKRPDGTYIGSSVQPPRSGQVTLRFVF